MLLGTVHSLILKIDVAMERKLSTVFALDVVGYSKLMADDEARTLSNLKMRRDFMNSLIEEFGGRIFNTAGDSVMAEFGSPVKVVECLCRSKTDLSRSTPRRTRKTK